MHVFNASYILLFFYYNLLSNLKYLLQETNLKSCLCFKVLHAPLLVPYLAPPPVLYLSFLSWVNRREHGPPAQTRMKLQTSCDPRMLVLLGK